MTIRRIASFGFVGLLIVTTLARSTASAQRVNLNVSPRRATIADSFQIRVTISGSTGGIQQPEVKEDGFQVVKNSTSSQIQLRGGRRSRTTTFDYTARPTRTGTISIAPVAITINGKSYSSRPATIEITPVQKRDDFIAEVTASREKLYVGEKVTLTLKIFVRKLKGRYAKVVPFPQQDGTWPRLEIPWFDTSDGFVAGDFNAYAQTLRPKERGPGFPINDYVASGFFNRSPYRFQLAQSNIRRTDSAGVSHPYFVFKLNKTLQADQVGTYEVEPVTARGVVFKDRPNAREPRAENFVTGSNSVRIVIAEPSQKDRPEFYTGAIGNFTISARLPSGQSEIWIGEPLTLELSIQGDGKLEPIGPVSLEAQSKIADVFRIHDEPTIGDIDPALRTKTFVYGVRPKREGFDAVPPIQFAYFDPKAERYVTITTQSIPVTVRKGRTVTSDDVTSFDGKNLVRRHKRLKAAVYPNYTLPDALEPQSHRQSLGGLWGHLGIVLAAPIAYVALLLFRLRRERLDRDPSIIRSRDAGRRARSTLRDATATLDAGHHEDALKGISRALTGFVADRLRMPADAMTPEECLRALRERGVDSEMLGGLKDIFETCEQARYASGAADSTTQLKGTAESALNSLEKVLR